MRSGLWFASGLAVVSLACSNEVAPPTDAEVAKTHALVTIEHTALVGATTEARTEAFARFVSLPAFSDDETVLDLAGMAPVAAGYDSCVIPKVDAGVSLATLEPVRDYKARHASTMLTFDAVVDAFGQIEKKQSEAAA